ncbi:NAD(P)H-dependent oxidoreductase [Amaricoccus sp.]|uniref:NAD(P)H-dependent oxidoreductase n=1 Tax=Amaricoccus sp. TaxID=1872485 RepID=UPI001B6EB250|nr:NAD(P)H-dependent oxidoreductase [Amaricoccus sp.]MBP7241859.1 NAD(P)H-dependent oxidoreductase [Amaricoccus sp.]
MRILVVFCHPCGESLAARLCSAVTETLAAGGHEVRLRDLYAEGFDPVIRQEEWRDYFGDNKANAEAVASHLEDLRWAEGLALVYPTWWYGPPAMLKGWLERVWLPGVTFDVPKTRMGIVTRKLDNIRLFVAVTTSGSPWWWLRLIRDPGRSLFTRGMRPLFHPRCRVVWRQLYSMDSASQARRDAFVARVTATLRQVAP